MRKYCHVDTVFPKALTCSWNCCLCCKVVSYVPVPLRQSPDFWWKFDLRFGLDCRGTQKWPPDKVERDRISTAFVPFFWKTTSGKPLSWSLPNRLAIYITSWVFYLENSLGSLAIFFIFRKLKFCPTSTLFLVILLLGSCFWVSLFGCRMGPMASWNWSKLL